jgi:assimilatory nitrate reductase catalytic subunit
VSAQDIRTTCPYCGVGCGLRVRPNGVILGDQDHPANFGRLCSKGAALAETLGAEDRLLYPEIDGRRATWDEALDLIAVTFAQTVREHGPDAVALYGSGQFLTEDYYVANKLMKGFIGSANIDTNSRLCMASSVAGHIRAFGEDIVAGCYDDLEEADLAVLVGSNTAWCHPVLYQRLTSARERKGTTIVVIDPRRTATCEIADIVLPLRAGTDVLLFNGLLVHLADTGALASAFVANHTAGFDDALFSARRSCPSLRHIAAATDLPLPDLRRFYERFAETERTVTLYSQGVNQSVAGTDKVNAIINCHLATGRIGGAGMGPFSLTGQPNAMGGREVGGLANQLAAHMSFADSADVERVRRFWNAPRMATKPGLKAVDLFNAVLDGKIKALWILGTNPAASMPRAGCVRAALDICPFVAVSDCWKTDTTVHAGVVLPAAGWGEKDGTVTNSERRISRQRAFRKPPGQARPDWWMLAEVGRRLGWHSAFAYQSPAAIFREHAALSGFENDGRRIFDIGALADLSDEEYERLQPVQWPCPRGKRSSKSARLFAEGIFPTTDGRARFVPTAWCAPKKPAASHMLKLNTGRVRDQWHTMTRTGRVPRLMAHTSEPLLDVHPQDAAEHGLSDGALARIESEHGTAILRVRISAQQRRGEVFAPMHWTDRYSSAGPVDRLVGAEIDPISGQPDLKAAHVDVRSVAACWHGLLLHRTNAVPKMGTDVYWVRISLDGGYAAELTGLSRLSIAAFAEQSMKDMLGVPREADLILYADPGRSVFRFAAFCAGRLEACLFLAPRKEMLPSCAELSAALGQEGDPGLRTSLLAGAALNGPVPEHGNVVCACFVVSARTIWDTIRSRRLASVAELGDCLRVGTNCGSCIPELEKLLHEATAEQTTGIKTSAS